MPFSFPLALLPPEIRQLIWEATLPGRRVFHVMDGTRPASSSTSPSRGQSAAKRTQVNKQTFDFHIRHAPPVAAQVCRESRAIALLRGFFLSPNNSSCPSSPGLWFQPQRDMLYFDRNMRRCITAKQPIHIVGMDRVRHVGVEWRAWFRDVPKLPNDDGTSSQWKAALAPLLLRCPRVESFSYVLPRVRHGGGVPSGREPYLAERYPCELVPLPENASIPWGRLPLVVYDTAAGAPGSISRIGGSSTPTEWRIIRAEMEAALSLLERIQEAEIADESIPALPCSQTRRGTMSVQGWWLVRLQTPNDYEHPAV